MPNDRNYCPHCGSTQIYRNLTAEAGIAEMDAIHAVISCTTCGWFWITHRAWIGGPGDGSPLDTQAPPPWENPSSPPI